MVNLVLGDHIVDFGLNALDSATALHVCSAEPASYADVLTYTLGNYSVSPGFFGAASNGSPSGRVRTSSSVSGGSITGNGTVIRWALVDATTSRLLAEGNLTGGTSVSNGEVFSLGVLPIHMLGVSASVAYSGPGDIATTANWNMWWGLRGFTAAYATGSNPAVDLVDQSGNNPITINILSTGALDIASISSWVTAHSVTTILISKLYDQTSGANNPSLSANHLVQATNSLRPTLTLSGLNGLPVMSFAGSQVLAVTLDLGTNIFEPFVYPLVGLSSGTIVAVQGCFMVSHGGDLLSANVSSTPNVWRCSSSGGGSFTATASDTHFHTCQMTINGATSELYIDGTSTTGSVTPGASIADSNVFCVGAGDASADSGLIGDICEGGIYSGSFSSFKANMNTNQTSYWGPFP